DRREDAVLRAVGVHPDRLLREGREDVPHPELARDAVSFHGHRRRDAGAGLRLYGGRDGARSATLWRARKLRAPVLRPPALLLAAVLLLAPAALASVISPPAGAALHSSARAEPAVWVGNETTASDEPVHP